MIWYKFNRCWTLPPLLSLFAYPQFKLSRVSMKLICFKLQQSFAVEAVTQFFIKPEFNNECQHLAITLLHETSFLDYWNEVNLRSALTQRIFSAELTLTIEGRIRKLWRKHIMQQDKTKKKLWALYHFSFTDVLHAVTNCRPPCVYLIQYLPLLHAIIIVFTQLIKTPIQM